MVKQDKKVIIYAGVLTTVVGFFAVYLKVGLKQKIKAAIENEINN